MNFSVQQLKEYMTKIKLWIENIIFAWTFEHLWWIACEKWCNHIHYRFKIPCLLFWSFSLFSILVGRQVEPCSSIVLFNCVMQFSLTNFEAGCNWCLRTISIVWIWYKTTDVLLFKISLLQLLKIKTTEKTKNLDQIRISDWP